LFDLLFDLHIFCATWWWLLEAEEGKLEANMAAKNKWRSKGKNGAEATPGRAASWCDRDRRPQKADHFHADQPNPCLKDYLGAHHNRNAIAEEKEDEDENFVSFVTRNNSRDVQTNVVSGSKQPVSPRHLTKENLSARGHHSHSSKKGDLIPPNVRQSRVARCILHKQVSSKTLQLPPMMAKSRFGRAMIAREKEKRKQERRQGQDQEQPHKEQRPVAEISRSVSTTPTMRLCRAFSSSQLPKRAPVPSSSSFRMNMRRSRSSKVSSVAPVQVSVVSQADEIAAQMAAELASQENANEDGDGDCDLAFSLRVSRLHNDGLLLEKDYRRSAAHSAVTSSTGMNTSEIKM
jgi:hypothetical protein